MAHWSGYRVSIPHADLVRFVLPSLYKVASKTEATTVATSLFSQAAVPILCHFCHADLGHVTATERHFQLVRRHLKRVAREPASSDTSCTHFSARRSYSAISITTAHGAADLWFAQALLASGVVAGSARHLAITICRGIRRASGREPLRVNQQSCKRFSHCVSCGVIAEHQSH